MKTKKVIIVNIFIFLIFISLFYYFSNYGTINNNNNGLKGDNNIINIEKVKSIKSYNEISNANIKEYFKIKNKYVLNKNSLDNVVSTCNFLEGKTNYLIELGKKVKEDRSIPIIDLGKNNLKEEKRFEELKDLEALEKGEIQGKYKYIAKKDFNRKNFKNSKEFFSYLSFYIFFLKDEKEISKYISGYIDELNKEKGIINENHILGLILSYYKQKGECKSLIEKNFILY